MVLIIIIIRSIFGALAIRLATMSQKKPQQADEGCSSSEKRKRLLPPFAGWIFESANHPKLLSVLEPLLRKIVKEEIETALVKHLGSTKRHCGKQIYPSMSRSLQLQFKNRLYLPVFTGTRIDGSGHSPITIALVDALTGQVVSTGPESSMRVEIVVLEGDFDGDDQDNWTFEDFLENIVREREGKRPLLAGEVFLNLQEGTGVVGELAFTDNSSWTRSRKFRLGARLSDNHFDGIRVREAKTESFVVKDHRGELYKKHYPPSLADEVWRIEKIGKDGAFHKRLSSENINTVKDFLTLLTLDSQRLRNILGTGMSAKMWEVTMEHARTCTLNNESYVYYASSEQRTGVVFNVIGELMGLHVEQQFVPAKTLSDSQKSDAYKLVKMAYNHSEEVMSYGPGMIPHNSLDLSAAPGQNTYTCSSNHKFGGFGFIPPVDTSPDTISSLVAIESLRSCEGYALTPMDNLDLRTVPESHALFAGNQTFRDEEHLQYLNEDPTSSRNIIHELESQSELGLAVRSFLAMPAKAAAHAKWGTLKLLFRWKFQIKKFVASKKSKAVALNRVG